MASRISVVALGVVALAASCTAGPGARPGAGGPAATRPAAGSAGGPCTPSGCISLSRLAHGIDSQLKGHVVGYVALIGPSHVVASGLARTAADPPKLAMGPDVMVNVLSVGKMFTTIAVLQSLARHHRSTGSRIWPFLPPDWVKGPGVGTITFGELLTHRAGFRLDSGLVFQTGNAARNKSGTASSRWTSRWRTTTTSTSPSSGTCCPSWRGLPTRAGRARRSRGPFLPQLCAASGLRPGGRPDATCAPVRHAVLMYPPPGAGTAPGKQAPVPPSACSGGGWFMTPAGVLRVLQGLISGSLLSASQRQQMDRNCLGWDCSITSQRATGARAAALSATAQRAFKLFGILAGTIPVVIATNSDPGKPFFAIAQTAVSAATSHR